VNYWWFFWGPPTLTVFVFTLLFFGVFFFLLGGVYLDFFKSKVWVIPAFIGKLSYGGYLYHSFVLYLLWPFFSGKNEWFDFFIFVTITFGLAELSYRYFEVPVNLWIRKKLGRYKNRVSQ
jgi:peptidoglycan/LPS O-acetylase OafA/YrhL